MLRHSHDLLATAEDLLKAGEEGPRQSNIRRATSTVYYALFDCLARTGADLLIGKFEAVQHKEAWVKAYRALDHRTAKNNCSNDGVMSEFPSEAGDFAKIFVEMQEKRHEADYNPISESSKLKVLQDIRTAKAAIQQFSRLSVTVRRAFAVYILLKIRKEPPPKTATKKTAAKTG